MCKFINMMLHHLLICKTKSKLKKNLQPTCMAYTTGFVGPGRTSLDISSNYFLWNS